MTITVTNIVAGPYVATGAEQSLAFAFKVFTPEEIEVVVGASSEPVDPSRYTVTRNLAVDGQVLEGGSVSLSPGAVAAGASIRLIAKPAKTQELVFSDTGSRLRNLNEVADRATLRALRAQYDGALEGAGQELIDLAEGAGAAAGAAAASGKANRSGDNVDLTFAYNMPILAPELNSAVRPLAGKLAEQLSLDDFAGTGVTQLNAALSAAGDRGRPVMVKAGGVLDLAAAPVGGVYTLWAEGPYTRTGAYAGDIGGKLIQPSGTGLLFDPFYIGQHPNKNGTFKFEEAFRALDPLHPTGLRTLSSATLAVASPNGSNAAVFTSRSSDGGSIGSGFALGAYVINDRTIAANGSIHGMWLFQGIAVRKPDAGTTFGMEPGVANLGDVQVRHPYYAYADKLTCAAWLASGGELTGANAISAYAAMVYNGAPAMTGLLVTDNALADRGGGFGELMAVPEKTYISQYLASQTGPVGQSGFQLSMAVSIYEQGSRITANDTGLMIASIDNNSNWLFLNRTDLVAGPVDDPWFTANNIGLRAWGRPNAANNVLLYGEGAGSGEAVVLADGADANVWLVLAGKAASVKVPGTIDAANDAAAATAGVPLNGLYRTGNQARIRIV